MYSANSVAYMQVLTKLTANTSSRFDVTLALGQLSCWLTSVVASTEAYDLPAAASKLQVTRQKHLCFVRSGLGRLLMETRPASAHALTEPSNLSGRSTVFNTHCD